MVRAGSTKSVGLFVLLTVLYPLVGLENTVITVVMFHVDSTLCGVSFEGFFGLYGFITHRQWKCVRCSLLRRL